MQTGEVDPCNFKGSVDMHIHIHIHRNNCSPRAFYIALKLGKSQMPGWDCDYQVTKDKGPTGNVCKAPSPSSAPQFVYWKTSCQGISKKKGFECAERWMMSGIRWYIWADRSVRMENLRPRAVLVFPTQRKESIMQASPELKRIQYMACMATGRIQARHNSTDSEIPLINLGLTVHQRQSKVRPEGWDSRSGSTDGSYLLSTQYSSSLS